MKEIDLWNNTKNIESTKKITVNLYCDEIKKTIHPITKEKWDFIGVLIVPKDIEEELLSDLLKARYFKEYSKDNKLDLLDKNSKYYKKNDRMVHFVDLCADTYYIAKRWHNYILHSDSINKIYFNILGINNAKLNAESFGNRGFPVVYNRFFRVAVVYPLLKYFSNYFININNIFHEVGSQQEDSVFPWHTIYKINTEGKWPIKCLNKEIQFLEKDHRKNKQVNFIQLIDIILGVTRNVFDNSTKDEFKIKLTEDFSGIVKRLIECPNNFNSNYCANYYKRMNISFFPKRKLDPKSEYYEIDKFINQFYKNRDMDFLTRHQQRLL